MVNLGSKSRARVGGKAATVTGVGPKSLLRQRAPASLPVVCGSEVWIDSAARQANLCGPQAPALIHLSWPPPPLPASPSSRRGRRAPHRGAGDMLLLPVVVLPSLAVSTQRPAAAFSASRPPRPLLPPPPTPARTASRR
jgi:hypothetical protein